MHDKGASTAVEEAIVHPTAIVHPSVQLGKRVEVGPYAVIADDVVIGDGTTIGPHVVIERDVVLGRENRLHPGVVVGGPPQHKQYGGERTQVRIGDRNVLGDYASISRAYGEGEATVIGNDNFIMSYVRIDHNCWIGNDVVLVSGVGLAGHVSIDDQAYVGGQAGAHQFVRIGRLGMVGAMTLLRQDVPPFLLAAGIPARAHALNTVGLVRAGVAPAHRAALKRAFLILYRSGLPVRGALARMEAELGEDPFVAEMITFIRAGSHDRGIVRWTREK